MPSAPRACPHENGSRIARVQMGIGSWVLGGPGSACQAGNGRRCRASRWTTISLEEEGGSGVCWRSHRDDGSSPAGSHARLSVKLGNRARQTPTTTSSPRPTRGLGPTEVSTVLLAAGAWPRYPTAEDCGCAAPSQPSTAAEDACPGHPISGQTESSAVLETTIPISSWRMRMFP